MDEVSVAYSKPVPTALLDQANVDIICQRPTLSMPGLGRRMLIIRKDAIEKKGWKVQTVQNNDLHYLLDLAASSCDIESTKPRGGATKQIKRETLESEPFQLGRLAISARM